ncbi:MAG: biopolymer transporter ExbD [Gemmataceae bacterium]|nr:biopolymer transporter ExbD [Gemmataceae bacterium]
MSHGSSEKCEPNMTPLLDLVLQLVMFFMLVANFVMDETNTEIKLPVAVSAKPLTPKEPYVFLLDVNEKGEVIFPENSAPVGSDGKKILSTSKPEELRIILNRRAEEDRTALKNDPSAGANADLRTLIILRIDKRCPFEKSYAVMKSCRDVGYTKIQLRARTADAAESGA